MTGFTTFSTSDSKCPTQHPTNKVVPWINIPLDYSELTELECYGGFGKSSCKDAQRDERDERIDFLHQCLSFCAFCTIWGFCFIFVFHVFFIITFINFHLSNLRNLLNSYSFSNTVTDNIHLKEEESIFTARLGQELKSRIKLRTR